MTPARYVPSQALIRALARPQPVRCLFTPHTTPAFTRTKTSKTAAARKRQAEAAEKAREKAKAMAAAEAKTMAQAQAPTDSQAPARTQTLRPTIISGSNKNGITFDPNIPNIAPETFGAPKIETNGEHDAELRPLSDEELKSKDFPIISYYEQDLDKGGERRLIERIATPTDRLRDKRMYQMIEESQQKANDPDYDEAPLNRRLLDSLLANPNFADLTQELKEIKADILTKSELAKLEQEDEQALEQEGQQMDANLRMASHQALQELIDDPDVGDARPALQEVLDKMPEMKDLDNPAFQAMFDKALAQLSKNPTFKAKMLARAQEQDTSDEDEWATLERGIDAAIAEEGPRESELAQSTPEDLEDVDKLLHQMRSVLRSFGDNSVLEAELDSVLSEDADSSRLSNEVDFEREMDPEELAAELTKLAKTNAENSSVTEEDEEGDEAVSPDLQAKVDKIMDDPKLLEKLLYIESLINKQPSDLTQIAHPVAPDPESLAASETATLSQRLAMARSDPEHAAALDSLRVRLPSPFNIAPALKSFNQALELAYVGANDDVRRILWRSYLRAKSLPAFMHNVGDDAWDILYYSQAVTWGANQNRDHHLRVLLADLKSVGKDGPPTHPSQLG